MSQIMGPALPFQSAIPGGIYNGKMIEVKGKIPYGADRFEINLMTGFDMSSDRTLHLGIRFDQRCVVRNHKQYDQWGPEERQGPFPFSFGRDFTMLILAEKTQYRIAVNNEPCWDFGHRLPMDQVKSIAVRGFFDVYHINFYDALKPSASPKVKRARTRLPPVNNPTIPYAYPIYDGLEPGMSIYINGRPPSNSCKFTISLQTGDAQYPPPDLAFHLDSRFYNRSVVRNTRCNGVWAAEETAISRFPFQPGISFEMVVQVEEDKFSVSINGQRFIDFRHRLRPLEKFDTLYIDKDVSISSIRFS
ncbi:unnamed protein product [Larinioides sclopetarius]|uniref:Galectin n=1 Tax=Larinioides sclopetarius TaxID=280406 RepID=A0AAV2AYW5_9ARAC